MVRRPLTAGRRVARRAAAGPVIIVSSLGRYRLPVMQRVLATSPDTSLYLGDGAPDGTVRVLTPDDITATGLHNVYLPGGMLAQRGVPWGRVVRARRVILDLNPRVPHVWAILLLRRSLGRPTCLWGHAWPRSGRTSRTEKLRHVMRALASGILTYTDTEAHELRAVHPRKQITSAPNALYARDEISFDVGGTRTDFLYVGRLVTDKKPGLAIRAFALMSADCPGARLTIIGDGPERPALEEAVRRHDLGDRVTILPYEDDHEILRGHYATAVASLSPGYVGLSAIQSFCFGVPMLVADREPHAPEIEAIRASFNARFFRTDDAQDMADAMRSTVRSTGQAFASGPAIAAACADTYSVEAMADGILSALAADQLVAT